MKSLCDKCGYPIAIKHSLIATWKTPVKCQNCEANNYRSHSISLLLFIAGCGLSVVLVVTVIFVTKNVTIGNILIVFGLSSALYIVECILLPLKQINLEKAKKTKRRELLWIIIFFCTLLILAISVR